MRLLTQLRKKREERFAAATVAAIATHGEEPSSTFPNGRADSNPPTIRRPPATLTAEEETAIRAWLARIEETDPATIAEIVDRCRRDVSARDYFIGRAAAELLPPKPDSWRVTRCCDCAAFNRTDHPNLGHCAMGQPEAPAGLWDTDRRHCEQYRFNQQPGA